MSANPNPPEPPQPTAEDPRLTAFLFTALEIGEKVLRSVGRQADLQAQPSPEGQPPWWKFSSAPPAPSAPTRAFRHRTL